MINLSVDLQTREQQKNGKMNYSNKLTTAENAVKIIKSDDKVFLHAGAVVPKQLVRAMTNRHDSLCNVKIYHILMLGKTEETAPYVLPEMAESFTHYALFTGDNTRKAVNEGRAYFMPVFLSEIPQMITKMGMDVAMLMVSPPDERGFCSLGPSVDISRAGYKSAKYVIAEINPNVPRTQGYSYIHLDEIDAVVETNYPIMEIPELQVSDVHKKIGENIASLIPDGACLQVGIGTIPDATLANLSNHKNLGVHSELISDGIMKLVEKGVITNEKKSINIGKVVTSIIMGTRKVYDWAHRNPQLDIRPSDYTNDVFRIAKNDNVIAINGALTIDLKGQVNADSLGKRFYSGIGGQVDFIRGAARSKGGKPIIALPSTVITKAGKTYSRIVPFLEKGAGVVTSEGDVQFVVTEFGVAQLNHKAVGERAMELIKIAHPDFQEELERTAFESGYKLK